MRAAYRFFLSSVAGCVWISGVQGQGFGITPAPQAGVIYAAPPLVHYPPSHAETAPAAKAVAPKPKQKTAAIPVAHERVVAKNDPRPSFYPDAVSALHDAADRYALMADQGGWPILPSGITLRVGDEGDAVLALRERLAVEGDLAREETASPVFDALLARAVKAFQARHGHSQTGLVAGATARALRVSARERAHQLAQSARRASARHFAFGQRYVVVNIPSASVEAIADGRVERRHIAVVGKKDRPSPEVETRITNVNFNPTWTVPVSIIKKDIIPKMQKDPGYLAKAKIRIYGISGNEVDPKAIDWTTERAVAFTLRQESGSANALGQVRIDMPNRDSVYMHDTPSKKLFLRDDRFHSSGCVRVEGVRDLADWLLEAAGSTKPQEDVWTKDTIAAVIKTGKRRDVRLATPVPVIWAYLTGYVTPDGQVHFREDVYGLDDIAAVAASREDARQAARGSLTPLALNTAPAPRTGAAHPRRAPVSEPVTRPLPPKSAPLVQRIDP